MAVWDNRSLRGNATQELREELAEFLWQQRDVPEWEAALVRLGEFMETPHGPITINLEEEEEEGEEEPRPASVAATQPPAKQAAPAKRSAGAPSAPPPPKRALLQEARLEEQPALDPDVADAIAKMFGLSTKKRHCRNRVCVRTSGRSRDSTPDTAGARARGPLSVAAGGPRTETTLGATTGNLGKG